MDYLSQGAHGSGKAHWVRLWTIVALACLTGFALAFVLEGKSGSSSSQERAQSSIVKAGSTDDGLISSTGKIVDFSKVPKVAPFSAPSAKYIVDRPPYPVNALGQTFGNANVAAGAPTPDLISAYSRSGVFGYVLASQVYPDLTKPVDGPQAHSIPLYAPDGVTVVGTFTSDAGTVVESPLK